MSQFRYSDLGVSEDFLKKMGEYCGRDASINQACEECAELIVALNHHRRGRVSEEEVCLEIADVIMMAEELRLVYGPDVVDKKIKQQVSIVDDRIEIESDDLNIGMCKTRSDVSIKIATTDTIMDGIVSRCVEIIKTVDLLGPEKTSELLVSMCNNHDLITTLRMCKSTLDEVLDQCDRS